MRLIAFEIPRHILASFSVTLRVLCVTCQKRIVRFKMVSRLVLPRVCAVRENASVARLFMLLF